MKILIRNKIVESFHFPFSEALTFSILIWSAWAFAEAFYWEKAVFLFDPNAAGVPRIIYIVSFLLYVALATIVALVCYTGTKVLLLKTNRYEPSLFRALALTAIVALFFVLVLTHYLPKILSASDLSSAATYAILILAIGLPVLILQLIFQWSYRPEFRLRRSGTMLLSVVTLTVVLSIVSFPLFSPEQEQRSRSMDWRNREQLMVFSYLKILLPKRNYSAVRKQ